MAETTELEHYKAEEKRKEWFNNLIAVTIALLASFTTLCTVKDDNIVQAMQQAQVSKVDNWAWYQSINVRKDMLNLELKRLDLLQEQTEALTTQKDEIKKNLDKILTRQAEVKANAEQNEKDYNDLNYRDDQFDLSDALISVAIALMALSSLVQSRALYLFGLIPSLSGVLMGLAGLAGWPIHPDMLTALLS